MHFFWNDSSPTARTSSVMSRSGSGAVLAYDPDTLPLADLEVDRVQRAEARDLPAAKQERGERAQAATAGGDLRIVLGYALQADEASGVRQARSIRVRVASAGELR